jgi:hypothetical protein
MRKSMSVNFSFPLNGLNKNRAVSSQTLDTSSDLSNVRPYDVFENRARGGQRPGLNKWGDGDDIGSGNPIVSLLSITYMEMQ